MISKHAPQAEARRRPVGRGLARGFTMVEMVVALAVAGLVMTGVMIFYITTTKQMFISTQKSLINKDMRNMTEQLAFDAREANFFVLYQDYTAADRTTPSQELLSGDSGDFLVLVFYGNETFGNVTPPANFNVHPVNEIVGYYREPYQAGQTDTMSNNVQLLPVHRFDLSVANGGIAANQYLESSGLPAGGATVTLESLLPNSSAATITSHPIVIDFTRGNSNGYPFHDFWGKSVMVNGTIYHGNNYSSASDTYNFTVSPRG